MKNRNALFPHCLTLGLLLLGSCTKNKEQLSPTPKNGQEDSQVLKQVFVDKQYARQLLFPLKNHTTVAWVPRWDQKFQRVTSGTSPDVYVPLEAPALTWIGVKKYLLIRQVNGKLEYNEASFLFKEKENRALAATNQLDFLAAFTGTLAMKNLATGLNSYFFFKKGVPQSGPPTTGKGAHRTSSSCYNAVSCRWDGYCMLSDLSNVHYGTQTYGIDNCDFPAEDNVGCSMIQWSLTASSSQMICAPGGGDNGGGGNGGGGGGDGDTGPDSDPVNNNDGAFHPAMTETPTIIGDTRKKMIKSWSTATTINVFLEYTAKTHVVDKLTVTSTGLTAATKFAQVGNGIASYNVAMDMYTYNATFQQVISTPSTGDVLGGPIFEVYGWYVPKEDIYSINFKRN